MDKFQDPERILEQERLQKEASDAASSKKQSKKQKKDKKKAQGIQACDEEEHVASLTRPFITKLTGTVTLAQMVQTKFRLDLHSSFAPIPIRVVT